jgi:LacI family transcriptional regulator
LLPRALRDSDRDKLAKRAISRDKAKPDVKRGASAKVGLRDVARAAGVSTATVSRATNSPALVSSELRERIEKVSKQLGWVPHGAARALTTGRSGAIGAVFPTLSHGDFARAIEALQDELRESGYSLLLACSYYDPEEEYQLVRRFIERGVDAIVLVGGAHKPELTKLIEAQNIPCVNTFVYDRKTHGTCIGPDNRKALRRLTEYLIDLGHRRFGLIMQESANNDRAAARTQGIHDALKDHGIELRHNHVVNARWGIAEGRQLFRAVVEASPRPTAVICGNAPLAVGAMLEAQNLGLAVPEDITIVGYDDIELMSELPVTVTTIRVQSDEVGRRAGRFLVAKLQGRRADIQWECEAELVTRASSGPPPKRKRRVAPAAD